MRLALLLLAATTLQAQSTPWIDLSGEWRIQEGDRPDYASPDFDDSRWATIQLPRTGQRPPNGFWLRKRFQLPTSNTREPLALTLGIPAQGIYEVYWNGRRIGGTGTWDDFRTARIVRPRTFPIPPELLPADGAVQLALRLSRNLFRPVAWSLPDRGPYLITSVAQAPVKEAERQLHVRHTQRSGFLILGGGFASVGFVSLFFWLIYPQRRDMLWFGLHLIVRGATFLYTVAALVLDVPVFTRTGFAFHSVASFADVPIFACFVFAVAGSRRWWYAAVWAGWCVLPVGFFLEMDSRLVAYTAQLWTMALTTAALLSHWIRQRGQSREDHLLLGLLLLLLSNRILEYIRLSLRYNNATVLVQIGPYMANISDLVLLAVVVAVLAMLLRRLAADRRKQQRMEDELAAARAVQQLLIPVSAVPGVEAVYEPAQEAGGDFYYVLDGRTIIVGDVSGKGLKAAMLVSLLIGVLRDTIARQPAAVLAALNRAIAGRVDGGFVTCCVVTLEANGEVIIANAGHPSPYNNGHEIEVPTGLPLGLDLDAEYIETRTTLQPGASITILSDGVVEAANAAGELFGFDRTAAISTKPAKEIAAAAKAWGQNDDITVVTVRRLA